ncbi:MAG: hypothetical protein BK997_00255 [Candidatus Micrarchaeum sp. ARMAN-1]|jgi:hypothetical protein|nr:MAG: hypothetical protein BK997_00255 [Candidatus Micrarchaeum sp. ARMAN-1]
MEQTEVITIRVPKGTKALMKRAKINISSSYRSYLNASIKSMKLHKLLKKIHKDAAKIKVRGDSTLLIREDRDSR